MSVRAMSASVSSSGRKVMPSSLIAWCFREIYCQVDDECDLDFGDTPGDSDSRYCEVTAGKPHG